MQDMGQSKNIFVSKRATISSIFQRFKNCSWSVGVRYCISSVATDRSTKGEKADSRDKKAYLYSKDE